MAMVLTIVIGFFEYVYFKSVLWFITICSAFQICWMMPKGWAGKSTQCAIIMSMAPINCMHAGKFVKLFLSSADSFQN